MKSSHDVIVIGGGVIGASIAYQLVTPQALLRKRVFTSGCYLVPKAVAGSLSALRLNLLSRNVRFLWPVLPS